MNNFLSKLATIALTFILWVRYKISVKGMEVLKDKNLKDGPVLIFPNHPALIDPFILYRIAGKKLRVKPLVAESMFFTKGSKFFMKMVGAKPVPEFDSAINEYKYQKAKEFHDDIIEDLKRGEKILLYPAGGLKRQAHELVGGRSLAHRLIQEVPETKIVLVRITGLWGSRFSTYFTGDTPSFWSIAFSGVLSSLKNLLFFTPRRKVLVEFSWPDKNFPRHETRQEFNRALENWYNQYWYKDKKESQERANLVPYAWYSKKIPSVVENAHDLAYAELNVPKDLRQDIIFKLSQISNKPVSEINDNDDLVFDIGIDSLDIASLYTYLDEQYDTNKSLQPGDLKKVRDLYAAALHMDEKKGAGAKVELGDKGYWPQELRRKEVLISEASTIVEAFLDSCDRMKDSTCLGDEVAGKLSYSRVKLSVIILARKIAALEGEHIAIMMPSTAISFMLILAVQLAGKVPVMLNWTTGTYFLNYSIDLMKIETVLTSEKFVNKLDNYNLGKALEKALFLENIKKSITLVDKLKGAFIAKRKCKGVLKYFKMSTKKDDVAVYLFTSGTESDPKAVCISHDNILSNQRAGYKAIPFNETDVLIMSLPPFHIFGFNLGLLSIIAGIRVYFSPDPLDNTKLVNEIRKVKASAIVMAPTFYNNLFRSASFTHLRSLRFFISGAEKASEELKEYVHRLGSEVYFLEGYGSTETSPIISVNRVKKLARGVGKVLDNLDIKIINPETEEILGDSQVGEICVCGPSVFKGYYKHKGRDPFIAIGGKRYYRTSDLGRIDDHGYLYLEGRLKRCIKKGGEMVNLTAIEASLLKQAKLKNLVAQDSIHPPFAVCAREFDHAVPKIVLFSEIKLSIEVVNKLLLEGGFSRLFKINEIILLKEIPILGSGKINYKELSILLNAKKSRV